VTQLDVNFLLVMEGDARFFGVTFSFNNNI